MSPILIFVVLGLVMVAAVLIGRWQEAERRKAVAAWAAAHRLTFRAEPDYGMPGRHPGLSALQRGENRFAYNQCEGLWRGRPLRAFDYHYETHHRDSKGRRRTHHHRFSAVLVGSAVPLQALRIRSEGLLDRLGELVGLDDIDFESAEFSRRFHVQADNRRWAYDVLHPRAMEFLLGAPDFALEFDHAAVLAWRTSVQPPADLEQAADLAVGLLDLLPEYLVRQQRAGPDERMS